MYIWKWEGWYIDRLGTEKHSKIKGLRTFISGLLGGLVRDENGQEPVSWEFWYVKWEVW